MILRRSLLAGFVLLPLLVGCNAGNEEKLYRVHGTAIFQGKPIPEVKKDFPAEDTAWEIDVAAKPFKK